MTTSSNIYERSTELYIQQNPKLPDEKTCANDMLDRINTKIFAENYTRPKGQKLKFIQDLPLVVIAMLIAARMYIALIAPGDKSQTNKKKHLTMEQKLKLPIGIYQESGDNKGVWEITNDPYGAFGELVEKYKSNATRKEKLEIFTKVKGRLRVVHKCVIPYYVAVNNFVWDVKNKKAIPFTPDLVFTSKIHTDLNVNATNPVITIPEDGTVWDVDSWLNSLGSPSFVGSVMEVIQAGCLPLAPRNQMVLFYQQSGNGGKGTIAQTLRNLLGENVVVNIPIENFSEKFALAKLPNSIAVIVDECDVSSFNKNLGKIKSAITGDALTIEDKYEKSYDYSYNGLILMCVNAFPNGADKTGSFKRRLHIIPFENCFTGAEKRYIKDRLIYRNDVLEYILKIVLVDMDYREHFTETEETKEALKMYVRATNSVTAFLQEILPECKWNLLPATDFLYEIYKEWYRKVSPSGKVIGRNDFLDSVREFVATDEDFKTEWEWTDSTRSQGYIDCSVQEPLLYKYNLTGFMRDGDMTCGSGRLFASMDKLKSKYSGLKRRSFRPIATNNNDSDSEKGE